MKTPLPRKSAWLGAVIAAFAALAVWADGELDLTFAPPSGVATIAFPNAPRAYLHAVQPLANGTIAAAGFAEPNGLPTASTPAPDILIARLSSTGALIGSALTISQAVNKAVINGPAGVVIAARTGDVFIVGSNVGSNGWLNATVYWLDPTGRVLASYTRPATGPLDQSACLGLHPIFDGQGRLVAACLYGNTNGTLQLAALRLSPRTTNYFGTTTHKLVADPVFGPNGFSSFAAFPAGYDFAGGTAITQDANSGAYYLGGFACTGNCLTATSNQPVAQFVVRLNGADGTLDTGYGTAGFAVALTPSATGGNPEGITLDNTGKVVVGGNFSSTGSPNGTSYVARLTSGGLPDSGFGTNGVVQGATGNEVIDVRTDALNRVYALDHGTHLFRLGSGGSPDASFVAGANVQMQNGAGSAWHTMQFVDSNQLSVYLAGGVGATCSMSCPTSAVIAKVTLVGSASTTALVSSLNPSKDATEVTFTATVSGSSPTGTVTFKDGTTVLTTVTLTAGDNGVATFPISSLSVGYHNITAIYGGDTRYGASASPPLVQVVNATNPVASTTVLTRTPGSISVGQSVTLTATVQGASPSGTVDFIDDTTSTLLDSLQLIGGIATLSTDVLSVGSHGLSASYSGDVSNLSSVSAPVTVTVTMAASATALSLTPTTSTDGQSVTLTAIVTGVTGLNPTGSVSFTDGTAGIGTGSLMVNGTASVSTSALTVGTHSLTASYGGDANYSPSTSAAVTATVNAKPVTPSGSSGGGGGGSFGLLELCALLLLLAVRALRARARPQGTIQSPVAIMRVPLASAKRTTYPPLEAKRWPGASVRRG